MRASRSASGSATTRSRAACASPPCQSTASSSVRARPSWRKLALPVTVSVRPMPQRGAVRHSRPEARAFVEEQRRGYERLMLRNLELLGPDDPFANMTSATMRCISRWYELGPSRYTEDCS